MTISGMYDDVAEGYDAKWTKPEDLAENQAVVELIQDIMGPYPDDYTVLDAGCGTGLALDLGIADTAKYTGFDPSEGMLAELRRKHPTGFAVQQDDEEWLSDTLGDSSYTFDLVISLFASPSYMNPESMVDLVSQAEDAAVFMLYDGKWRPDYYDGTDAFPEENVEAVREALDDLHERWDGRESMIRTIGNFETHVFLR